MTQQTVTPLPGAAPYLGGKRNLAERIIERMEVIPHNCYAEPFIGMGGIFFRRTKIPKCEVINDYSNEVVNFFRIVQRHYRAMLDELRFTLAARRTFYTFLNTPIDAMTDVQRAARFFYLQHNGYCGKPGSTSFAIDRHGHSRFNIRQLRIHIERLHERLASVMIESLHYSEFITRYDGADTLFYLDPPYYGCENDYGKDLFSRDDFARLAGQLVGIHGAFILSLNDRPEVREIFAAFEIEAVQTTYGIGRSQAFKEVLISNRRLECRQPKML